MGGSEYWHKERLRLLLFIGSMMTLALIINLALTSDRVRSEAQKVHLETADTSADLLANSLSGLIFNFQLKEAQVLLDELVAKPTFSTATVRDVDGTTLVEKFGKASSGGSAYVIERALVARTGEHIGDLQITVSGAAIAAAASETFRVDAALGSLQTIAILLAVFVGTSRLMDALAQANRLISRQANRDKLTGLANRRGLNEAVQKLIVTNPGARLGMVHIDLDRFKSINDRLGHATGDKVLVELSNRLRKQAGKKMLVARAGGDEFLALFRLQDENTNVSIVANRLLGCLSSPLPPEICRFRLSARAGFLNFHLVSEEDFDKALTAVDLALHEAKKSAGGHAIAFREDMRDAFSDNQQLLDDLADGLENDEFEPWLQPQFDSLTGRLEGFEALVRWRSEKRGLVTPGHFLQTAADAGLLNEIDRQVVGKALRALQQLRHHTTRRLRLSLNLTASRLFEPEIVDLLLHEAAMAGVEPQDISLEILETVFMEEDSDLATDTIRLLADAGFQIELDDFGTGHASLSNLTKFPVSRLKIDRHFIRHVDSDEDNQKITRSLVALARQLGISPLAEGVETLAEARFLRDIGCTAMQGFFFAKPMQLDHAIEWCQRNAESRVATIMRPQQVQPPRALSA